MKTLDIQNLFALYVSTWSIKRADCRTVASDVCKTGIILWNIDEQFGIRYKR